MINVTFKKTFLTGLLEGLTVPQKISFATAQAAADYVDYLTNISKKNPGKDCMTGNKFLVSEIYS